MAVESRLTVLALDGWMAFDVVRSRPSSIYWRHTERYAERLIAIQVSYGMNRIILSSEFMIDSKQNGTEGQRIWRLLESTTDCGAK
ncbi:hypothetical protein [Haloplanus salinarum]|uniref:hypothetical protein n=1 Tax=Haloplanus salinarum TaxID=1912324 RepID=UPI00214ADC20|nr:hypothetical protein [Haloplanus salinarum]